MNIVKDLGAVSAYALAVKYGYTGTEEEWVNEQEAKRKQAVEAANRAAVSAGTAAQMTSEAKSEAASAEYYKEAAANSAASALADRQEAARQAALAKTYSDNASAVTGVQVATEKVAGIIKGGENHIAEDGTLQITRKTTDTTLSNSHAGGIRINEIIGKSEQKSYSGKNLFDIASALDAYSSTNINLTFNEDTYRETGAFTVGVIDQTIGQITELILSPGEHLVSGSTYYISFYCNQPSPEVKLYIGSEECTISDTELNVFQFTTGNMINFDFEAYGLGDAEVTFTNMMISTSADTAYEKYVGGIPAPNPDYPQEIKSVEVGEIKSFGKNLLNYTLRTMTANGVTCTNNGDGTYTLNGTAALNTDFLICSFYFGDESYKLIGTPKGISNAYLYIKSNGSDTGDGFIVTGLSSELTVGLFINKGVVLSNAIFKPMLTTDLDATYDDFEPYTESTVNLSTPITLRGIGDTKDRIVRKDDVWGVERKIRDIAFDEKSTWVLQHTNDSTALFRCSNISIPLSDYSDKYLCTHALPASTGADSYSVGSYMYVGQFRIRVPLSIASTAEEFNTWISSNPIEVTYELVEHSFEPLSNADQIALSSLVSFDTITYLAYDSEIAPVIDLEYGTSRVGALALENENDTSILKRNATYKFGVENGIPYIEEI